MTACGGGDGGDEASAKTELTIIDGEWYGLDTYRIAAHDLFLSVTKIRVKNRRCVKQSSCVRMLSWTALQADRD